MIVLKQNVPSSRRQAQTRSKPETNWNGGRSEWSRGEGGINLQKKLRYIRLEIDIKRLGNLRTSYDTITMIFSPRRYIVQLARYSIRNEFSAISLYSIFDIIDTFLARDYSISTFLRFPIRSHYYFHWWLPFHSARSFSSRVDFFLRSFPLFSSLLFVVSTVDERERESLDFTERTKTRLGTNKIISIINSEVG